MRVEVFEPVNVVVRSGVHKVYQPGLHIAAEALVEQIEKQGKGRRVPRAADDAPAGDKRSAN